MKLKEIYSKSIDRPINPAVVVGNQSPETIITEIEEYVFTRDIIDKLYKALSALKNNSKIDKTGIWINGYYGSGKSHFIKYLHYCIDRPTSEKAFNRFLEAVKKYDPYKAGNNEEITENNIRLLQKWYTQTKVDDILFNVEDETDDGSGEKLTRIFLSMFNRFRHYNSDDIPLAILFEKYLDEKGKLSEFKTRLLDEYEHDWDSNAANIASYELKTILKLAKEIVPEMDIESLHTKLSDKETYRITLNHLSKEINEYLSDKDDNYRLVFLVDEVSQYIGKDESLLLNLQEIVSNLSDKCKKRVWVACTAQQVLEDVTSETGLNPNDEKFGKILGRFETRISLDSTDPSYITQIRVLDKSSYGLKTISEFYKSKKDEIENQFKINHELYRGFTSLNDFALSYPFVPYQFKLIAHVFDAFQHLRYVIKEVKDNERSVIGITHSTAKRNAEKEVGTFIPFDAFFNDQFNTNLTQIGRRAIQNAIEFPYVQSNEFAMRVVKVLFMISNLHDAVRITFPSNIDNLIVLMMTDADENKLQLKNKIQEVLEKLLEGNIIREEKKSYFFYNEEEIDVTSLIKNTIPNLEFKLQTLDELFRPLLKIDRKHRFQNNDFVISYNVDEKTILRGGDFTVKIAVYENNDINQMAMNNNTNDILLCVGEWFGSDKSLKNDFEWYCKVNKFLFENKDAATGSREKTLETFRSRNSTLYDDRILPAVKSKLIDTKFISGHQIFNPRDINGTTPAERFKNMLEKHISSVYKYHHLANGFPSTAADLRAEVQKNETMFSLLNEAEKMVDDHITGNGGEMTVNDIISKFAGIPFGWKDTAIIYILVTLNKKKKREFKYRSQPRFGISEFVEKALITSERMVCEVVPTEEISQEIIDKTILVYRNIFNVDIPSTTDGNSLFENIILRLNKQNVEYLKLKDDYYGKYPFAIHFDHLSQRLTEWTNIRDPKRLFTLLEDQQSETKLMVDQVKALIDFISRGLKEYDTISTFHKNNTDNFKALEISDQEKAENLGKFLMSDTPEKEVRIAVKVYKEIKDAIDDLSKKLKEKTLKLYEGIFEELEKIAKEHKITDANVYADKTYTVENIKKIISITQLRLNLEEADRFKSEQIESIIKHAASGTDKGSSGTSVGEPEVFFIKNVKSVIKSEKELDDYLAELRRKMIKIIQNKKTIIIK